MGYQWGMGVERATNGEVASNRKRVKTVTDRYRLEMCTFKTLTNCWLKSRDCDSYFHQFVLFWSLYTAGLGHCCIHRSCWKYNREQVWPNQKLSLWFFSRKIKLISDSWLWGIQLKSILDPCPWASTVDEFSLQSY